MEQKEWATIEEDITQLETKLETLTEEMVSSGDEFCSFTRTTRSGNSNGTIVRRKNESLGILE